MQTLRSYKKFALLCTGLTVFIVAGLLIGTMMAVGPADPAKNKLFELGKGDSPMTPGLANLLGDVLQPGADWDDLFAADRRLKDVYDEFGNPGGNGVPDFLDTYGSFRTRRDAAFIRDDLSADGTDDTSRLLTPGQVGPGNVFPEHDLGNLYAYTAFDEARDLIVYLGVERLDPANADSHVTLEFNQSHFSVDGSGNIQGSRTDGDVQVRGNFVAGALTSVEVSTWGLDASDSTYKFLSRETLGMSGPGDCNAGGTVCVECNTSMVTSGSWESFDASGNVVTDLTSETFMEVGVNVGRILGSDTYSVRFQSMQATTPEDYAVGQFERASFSSQEGVDGGCMQDVAGFGLQCTANDIQIASIYNVNILDDGCAFPGDTVTLTFSAEVLLTAQGRHDLGIYFATDGGDALTGSCRIETVPYTGSFDVNAECLGAGTPFDCCTGAGTGSCAGDYTDLDNICKNGACVINPPPDGGNACVGTGGGQGLGDCGEVDLCGDIDDDPNPIFIDITDPLVLDCVDTDFNGLLDVASCQSWRQPGSNEICLDGLDAFPGAPSKCRCDPALEIPIDVPGAIIVDKVTLDPGGVPVADATQFDFSITGADADLPDNFMLADADAPHQTSFLDVPAPYNVSEAPEDGWDLVNANCVSNLGNPDQDPTAGSVQLDEGEILTCTFTNQQIDPCFNVDCSGLDDSCNDGVCNPDTGICEAIPKADSTPCEDGDICTSETGAAQTPDHCEAGVCVGIPVDCSGEDDQCNVGVCNDATGACEAEPVADSTPCEDGDFCTSETGAAQTPDHCEAGVCVGIPVDCSGEDDQCNVGVCNDADGACVADPVADSTPCEDGDFCTSETGAAQTPDHCEAGVCVGIPVDCSGSDDQCNVGVCNDADGACVADPVADSTPCEDGDFCTSETGAAQTPDHCEAGVCVGIPVDCSGSDDQCNVGVCNDADGACVADPVADSTPCEDGDFCTSETGAAQTPDHCEAGVCVGIPVDCSGSDDQCNVGVCNDADGACVADPVADSTPCEDGDFCTSETGAAQTPDHCEAGVCVGIPVDCSGSDDQCNVGVCNDADGACVADPVADSTPCEDGDFCTSETGAAQTPDHCEAGVCVGIPVDCSGSDDQCNVGVCNDADGACVADPVADSTPCEDGDSCTSETGTAQTPDHCEAGMCVGIPVDCSGLDDQCNVGVCDDASGACVADPVADSTPCEDGDSCTSETGTAQTPDHCEAGMCVGIPVDCSGLDDQCNVGVCDDASGACVADPVADSTPCEDGDSCTSETGTAQTPDHCEAGMCVGIPVDCSGLDDQCNVGVCDDASGACVAEPVADSTPCEDGDSCTSETGVAQTPDHCESGMCVGIPVDCSGLDDQCNVGVCDDASGACVADPVADSTPCEDGDSCTSETGVAQTPDHCESGMCVGIPVDCSGLDDQCNVGVCDDASGACVADPVADSTPCEDGDSCTSETGTAQTPDHCEAGMCVGIPVDCSGLDDQCNVGVCDDASGACVADPVADSTPCEDGDSCTSETGTAQTPDHCEAGMCVGIPVDCSGLDDQCNVGVCDDASGACVADPVADSTPCEDGDSCTSETGTAQTPDHCEAGMCVGIPVDCSGSDDQCNVGVCDDASGACVAEPVADSTPCEDGDSCTSETGTAQTPDHCESGMCVGIPVDCSGLDDQCNVGVCDDASGACVADPVADSTPCEDGDSCTSETGVAQTPDHCESGMCVGIPVDCSGLDDQCNVGVCDDATGACVADPVADSTPCEDGDSCTSETGTPGSPDHCEAGMCVGIPVDCSGLDDQCNVGVCDDATGACVADPVADSTPCEDGDSCTSETGTPGSPDHCEAGMCVGIPVDCSGEDDQCNVGVCDDATGACVADPVADSTPCEDGDSCTSETGVAQTPDHCESGVCVGIPVDCSGEDDQCNVGVCDDATGVCIADPVADSTPCEDGDSCTSETGVAQTPDHCESGVCVGIPVDCSGEDDQCNVGVCDDATGACVADPVADSTPCEDGDSCTSETGTAQTPDHCEAGVCTGIPVDCSGEDDQCNVGVCDDATGACVADPVADSTPCEDGDSCTSETGVAQTPDHCEAGVCTGIPVDCSGEDDQCNVGVCDDATGACIADPVADSTPCEDGDSCTSETGTPQTPDHCEAGMCVGIPVDCSGAGDQCNDGVCDPGTGACVAVPVADSTPCEDGDFCTSETGVPQGPDHCEAGMCVGVPVDCGANVCGDEVCDPSDGSCMPTETCAHTQGYWHRQCLGDGLITPGRGNGRGPTGVLEDDWKAILAATDAYLADVLYVFGGACQEGMVADPQSDPCERGLKQLTALVFNVSSDRIQTDTPIDVSAGGCSATTVGDLLAELGALWTDPMRTENDCMQINDCAVIVNESADESLLLGDSGDSDAPAVDVSTPDADVSTPDVPSVPEETTFTPLTGSGSRTVTETVQPAMATVEDAEVASPATLLGIPTRESEAPVEKPEVDAGSQPANEDPLDAIERHLGVVGKAGVSQEDRLASQDALLTALSGGYDPAVRLQIVRSLIGNVDPALRSLLARHVEAILDEARDFDKDALALEAERLLKALEPEVTEQ